MSDSRGAGLLRLLRAGGAPTPRRDPSCGGLAVVLTVAVALWVPSFLAERSAEAAWDAAAEKALATVPEMGCPAPYPDFISEVSCDTPTDGLRSVVTFDSLVSAADDGPPAERRAQWMRSICDGDYYSGYVAIAGPGWYLLTDDRIIASGAYQLGGRAVESNRPYFCDDGDLVDGKQLLPGQDPWQADAPPDPDPAAVCAELAEQVSVTWKVVYGKHESSSVSPKVTVTNGADEPITVTVDAEASVKNPYPYATRGGVWFGAYDGGELDLDPGLTATRDLGLHGNRMFVADGGKITKFTATAELSLGDAGDFRRETCPVEDVTRTD